MAEPETVFDDSQEPRIYRASFVLPVVSEPIEGGAVLTQGNRVVKCGKWADLRKGFNGAVVECGRSVLMPGLINAHCHLDYTDMAGAIPKPRHFHEWIQSILSMKSHWSYSEYAASWIKGAHSLLRSGVTSVFDIEAVPELIPEVWDSTDLRIWSFLEMTGVKSGAKPSQILRQSIKTAAGAPKRSHAQFGLSPHAPYSTPPPLLDLVARESLKRRMPVATHVAESQAEFDMFSKASGPLHNWLKSQRDMSDCGSTTPVKHLHRHGLLGANLLAIHANYLVDQDVELLAHSGSSVVHCPRSHAYFGHKPFPLDALLKAGVNVCLGTDSMASVDRGRSRKAPELDMLEELRTFSRVNPRIKPSQILHMSTLNAARSIQRGHELGSIAPGTLADFAVLPLNDFRDPHQAVLAHRGPVAMTIINGRICHQA